jgi:hypothetical protein
MFFGELGGRMGAERREPPVMADPMQIPHGVLSPAARRRGSTTGYHVRWWAVAAVVFLLIYGSIFVLFGALT